MSTAQQSSSANPSNRSSGPHIPARGKFAAAVLAIGLLAVGLNLRIGVASVGPVLPEIRDDLALSETVASLLTTIPVIAFGAFAFFTPGLIRRLGMYRLLGAILIALAAGIALRLQPSLTSLFVGTLIIGAAIAIGNVVMPAAIKHDFPHRTGLMMGLYSTVLFLGAAVASGLTVPLLPLTGNDWRLTLALWAIPAALAFLILVPQLRRSGERENRRRASPESDVPKLRRLLTDLVALAVTAFMGIQSMSYYAALPWIPTILQDHGMDAHDAGWMLSFSAFPGIAAALIFPGFAKRMRRTWIPVVLAVALTGAGYIGLIIAPVTGVYAWMILLGLGQGASISLALSYIVGRSPDAQHTGQLSTMAQGFGYLFAGLGPVGIGALHTRTGGWTVPLAALSVLLIFQLIVGVAASRDRHVLAGR